MSILTDAAIVDAIENGDLEIDPFRPEQLNPVSYDLTLGDEVVVYKDWVRMTKSHEVPYSTEFYAEDTVLDVRQPHEVLHWKIDPIYGFILRPDVGYLMHTVERIHTDKFVSVLDGKSSLGRLFVQIHTTAGYGDPHFNGQYTLEVTVKHPIRLFAGMRIAQMRFHTFDGELIRPYNGNYKGETAKGAVASRAWKMFQR